MASVNDEPADLVNRPQDPARDRCIVPRGEDLPPPPPGVRYVPVPVIAVIVIADDDLRSRIDRFFHWPMILLALLILPLLALEFLAPPQPGTPIWWVSAIGLALIWIAFFIEFVVKISIAESRFEYVKHNWLDVIILMLPVLRPLRVAYLARTSRVFTLRGVGMKFLRYAFTLVVGLEATERMLERIGLRVKDGRQDPQTMTRLQLIREVKQLRKLTDQWQAWYHARKRYEESNGAVTSASDRRELTEAPFDFRDDHDLIVPSTDHSSNEGGSSATEGGDAKRATESSGRSGEVS